MIEGAIFDLDGTLLDSMGIWQTVGTDLIESLGHTPEEGTVKLFKTLTVIQAAEYIKEHYGAEQSPEELKQMMLKSVERQYLYTLREKAGVLSFLKALSEKGVKMCVATASEKYQVQAVMDRCGISQYIHKIFTCTEVGAGKDKPYIYRTALEYLGTEKETTLVFEDVLHCVKTATDDGFRCVGIYDKYAEDRDIIKSLCEVYITDYSDTKEFWAVAESL